MTRDEFNKRYPEERAYAYHLGTHWPEAGAFDLWLADKIKDFKKHYEYMGHETGSTYSGGTLVLAYGVPQKHFDALMEGTACFLYPCRPDCYFTTPDDLAIHLIDRHGWGTDEATAWLRKHVEPRDFNKEP